MAFATAATQTSLYRLQRMISVKARAIRLPGLKWQSIVCKIAKESWSDLPRAMCSRYRSIGDRRILDAIHRIIRHHP
jgi:hypothetical protein